MGRALLYHLPAKGSSGVGVQGIQKGLHGVAVSVFVGITENYLHRFGFVYGAFKNDPVLTAGAVSVKLVFHVEIMGELTNGILPANMIEISDDR